jgi:hypothetical protein
VENSARNIVSVALKCGDASLCLVIPNLDCFVIGTSNNIRLISSGYLANKIAGSTKAARRTKERNRRTEVVDGVDSRAMALQCKVGIARAKVPYLDSFI